MVSDGLQLQTTVHKSMRPCLAFVLCTVNNRPMEIFRAAAGNLQERWVQYLMAGGISQLLYCSALMGEGVRETESWRGRLVSVVSG